MGRFSLSFTVLFSFTLLFTATFALPRRAAMPSNTAILLVPGAFHIESTMDLLGGQLQQAGYDTRAMGLVTVNNAHLTIKDDVAALQVKLLDLIEQQGKDILLYLHSYAGMPGSTAIEGFSKAERAAKGQKGGIIGLIYQSAFTPQKGNTLVEMIGGSYAPWQDPNNKTGLVGVINPKETFYADVVDPLATQAVSQVYGQSISSFNTPSGPVFYADAVYNKRRVYVHTNLDQALPPFAQDAFVGNSGTTWDIRKLNTSHSPFLSEPAMLSKLVQSIITAFEGTY